MILGAAASGVSVILDGMATTVAALIAVRLEPAVQSVLIAGQRSRELGHGVLLTEPGWSLCWMCVSKPVKVEVPYWRRRCCGQPFRRGLLWRVSRTDKPFFS